MTLPSRELHAQLNLTQSSTQGRGRYFTVKDSIEMSRFDRAWRAPEVSPDKQYFSVVTTSGNLQSNEIESTLWVFRSDEVKQFLRTSNFGERLLPKVLANVAAVPNANYPNSYAAVITSVQWWPDSQSILFLGQDSQGVRRLYRADLLSGSIQALTPDHCDVTQYEFEAGGTIVYRRAMSSEKPDVADLINGYARNVTGLSIESILFAESANYANYNELWLIRGGHNLPVTDPRTGKPVRLSNSPPPLPKWNPLSISPDGHSIIALIPTENVQTSWTSYEPAYATLRLHSKNPNATGQFSVGTPAQYAVVDLVSGKVTPLVDAPHAHALGYGDRNLAIWWHDSKKVLLTNTYLSLDVMDKFEKSRRLRPCAAVLVDVVSKANSCVVFSREKGAPLLDASFGQSYENVVLSFGNAREGERYDRKREIWKHIDSPRSQLGINPALQSADLGGCVSETLCVTIKQDLNTPPTLWASDRETGRSQRIWDPNPQLTTLDLGQASVFHWKDKTGYDWIGGLVKPPDYASGKRYPLVIQTHGFMESEFLTDGMYTTAFAARPIAAAGIVVLQVRERFDHLVTANEALEQVRGYESAIEQLDHEGLIDPSKVGIIGFSRTCYYVESALIDDPKRYAAATIADGVDESYVQYLLFSVGRPSEESEEIQIYGGKPFGEGLRRWVDRAPSFHLDKIQAPVRIEAIAPGAVLEEWEIYASLYQQGKPVELIYIPKGQHILQKPLERMASQQGNVDWFRFWLKEEEDLDPTKAEQYSRWRQLRSQFFAQNAHR